MKLTSAFVTLALFAAGSSATGPDMVKRANNGKKGLTKQQQTDRLVSQFALTLENLEVRLTRLTRSAVLTQHRSPSTARACAASARPTSPPPATAPTFARCTRSVCHFDKVGTS